MGISKKYNMRQIKEPHSHSKNFFLKYKMVPANKNVLR